jgi:transcriptional regulator with XRE-family HTH domain
MLILVENFSGSADLAELAKKSFGQAVRSYRVANDWTQEELARALVRKGISATQTMIAKIERGDRPTSVAEAAVIAAAFAIPVQALFPLDGRSAAASHLGSLLTSFHTKVERLNHLRAEASDTEASLHKLLDQWDEYVAGMPAEVLDGLNEIGIDGRLSSENGMRGRLDG